MKITAFILLLGSFVPLCFAGETASLTPNLVLEPQYLKEKTKSDEVAKGSKEEVTEDVTEELEKLQYIPVSDDSPLLQERDVDEESLSGSAYKDGKDLFVSPEPDFALKEEAILDKALEPDSSGN